MTTTDEIDRRILRELQRDGRLSNVALAERVNLSPSACLRRVQELERSGIIRGYRAILDAEQMGRGFTVYLLVGLSLHTKDAQEGFERAMAIPPEVVECHNVAGAYEYILRIESADLADYKRFHTEVLGTQKHVSALTSYIVMGTSKDDRSI